MTHTERLFEYRAVERKKLTYSLVITLAGMVLELAGGALTKSMALISDAGHMFTHAFAITVSLIAIRAARSAPCHHRTFGLYRAEVLAAFINGLFLLSVVGIIVYESIRRILHPAAVWILPMMIVAVVGLMINGISILLLSGSRKNDLNVRSVFYHMAADAFSSIGIIIGAIIMGRTGWKVIDPILSIGISVAILAWAWGVLKDSGRILLEMTPEGITVDRMENDLKHQFPEIQSLTRIHFWTIAPDMVVFSAYLAVRRNCISEKRRIALVRNINRYLKKEYHVVESTIQVVS